MNQFKVKLILKTGNSIRLVILYIVCITNPSHANRPQLFALYKSNLILSYYARRHD